MLTPATASAQAYKKRVLIYGPALHDGWPPVNPPPFSFEVEFVNNHPTEFEPVDTSSESNAENAPGKSQIWGEQKWISATLADFQQFDAIVISDQGGGGQNPNPNWAAALDNRAIWGSAINGNVFITSGDPINDGAELVFRQGLRFAAAQAGNAHGRTGLYVALDHTPFGESIGGIENSTEISILSWFGSFRAVALTGNTTPTRLISQNPFLNVLGADVVDYSGSTGQGFHSWPEPFMPVAIRMTDPFPTPTSAPFYFAPCEADTGYEYSLFDPGSGMIHCAAQGPLVYMLAKAINGSDLTRVVAAQCNIAKAARQQVNFSAYSMLAIVPDPNNAAGPTTPISWRVVSGPNQGLTGRMTRRTTPPYGIPTGTWDGQYTDLNSTAGNFQDVVQVFMDYDNDMVFDDLASNPSLNDPDDPDEAIDFGATFTVNWGTPHLSVVKLSSPAAAAEPATSAYFRVSRTGSTAAPLTFSACLSGSASPNCAGMMTYDYVIRINGVIIAINSDSTFTYQIPTGAAYVDVEIVPVDDTLAEGPETVRIALEDVLDGSYVVGGNGFAELTLNDNDQPVVTLTYYTIGWEGAASGSWMFDTGTAITQPVKVYFSLSGTATHEVDYVTSLVPATDDSATDPNILLPSGTGRVTIDPSSSSPIPGHHATFVNLVSFQDSRTEGTESATATLLTHPFYKNGSPAAASVNITDDDSPKIPANGYTITDLGDATHSATYAAGINNAASPQIAGSFIPTGMPLAFYRAFRWAGGAFTDIPPPAGTTPEHYMVARGINDAGWEIGYGFDQSANPPYYWRWDGSTTIKLQTPTLNTEPNYGPSAINDANWIVGSARNDQFSIYRATRWDASGNWVNLGGLSINEQFSAFAWAVSSSMTGHRVVGESQFNLDITATTTAYHAYRTQLGSEPQQIVPADDLGNSLASETSSSGAYAVNNLFEIAGYSASSATEKRAAYKDGNSRKNLGWRTLGVLAGGSGSGLSAQALGMNDVGLIVGWSRTTTSGNGNPKAVVWENYQTPAASDLNLKIPTADRPNWVLLYATGINASGKIVGYGLKNGQLRAFILTPIP